jgi:hypothetical protein
MAVVAGVVRAAVGMVPEVPAVMATEQEPDSGEQQPRNEGDQECRRPAVHYNLQYQHRNYTF